MESPRRGFALCVSALAALLSRPCWAGSSGPDPLQVQMHHPAHGNMVLMALHGAYRKLGKPACQQVLDDFQDSEGRTLRENLEPLGIEAAEYLSLLTYREGRDLASGRATKGASRRLPTPGTEWSSSASPPSASSARGYARTLSSTRCSTAWGWGRTLRAAL